MALPYPGMDFTALDVLHAADLDKMVANIDYLDNKFPVNSDNISMSGSKAIVRTSNDQSGTRTAIYFADGTMIVHRVVSDTIAIDAAIGSLYYRFVPASSYWALAPSGDTDFYSKPTVTYSIFSTGQYCWLGNNQGGIVKNSSTGNRWAIPNQGLAIYRATSHNGLTYEIHIHAVGRWKA